MYASVPGTSPCSVSVSASLHLREAEVEDACRDLRTVGEEDVRRLHVTVEDPRRVRVRQPVADLRARLDRGRVVQLVRAQRLAEGLAGNELVRDVDVARVVREAVRAQAGAVAQPGGGLGLALGARGGLPLARDDLQRDIEACLLVAGEPDRAGAATAERLEGPVAAEHELGEGEGLGGLSHALERLATAPDCPS